MSTPSRYQIWTQPLLQGRLGQAEDPEPDPLPEDPIDYASLDEAGFIQVTVGVVTAGELLTGETVTSDQAGNPERANDRDYTTQSHRGSGAEGSPISWYWAVDLGSAAEVTSYDIDDPIGGDVFQHGGGFTNTVEHSDNGSSWTSTTYTYSTSTVPTGLPFPLQSTTTRHTYTLDTPSTHRYWRIVQSVGAGFHPGSGINEWYIYGSLVSDETWTPAPAVNDGDDATYAESDVMESNDEWLRVALEVERLIYRAELRIGTENAGSTTYEIYGSDDALFTAPVLLDSVTFTATGSYTAQEVTFAWLAEAAYQYYEIRGGPDDTRRVYDLNLFSAINAGFGVTDHPALTGREEEDQHPATAVSYDGTYSGLASDNVQDAIDELAADGGGGSIIVEEEDGSPSVDPTTTIRFPNGTVTDLGSGVVSIRDVPSAFIGARVYNSTTQNVSDVTFTAVTFDTENFDTDGFHSTSSNTSRFTIPAGLSGKYLLTGSTSWDTNATNDRYLWWRKNGSDVQGSLVANNADDNGTGLLSSTVLDLAAGDYVELFVYQDSGATRTIGHASVDRNRASASVVKLDSGKVGAGIGVRALRSTTQSINDATWTTIQLNATDTFDTDGFHDPSTNNTRCTIPAGLGGKYLAIGNVYHAASNSTGGRYAGLGKNGAASPSVSYQFGVPTSAENQSVQISDVMDLVAGDYVELYAYQNSGSARNVNSAYLVLMRLDSGSSPTLTSVILSPSSDTFINQQATTTNEDSNTGLLIGNAWGTASFTRYALFTFDTASLVGKTIYRAELRLLRTDSNNAYADGRRIEARRILRAYNPTQVTWNVYSTGNNWTTAGGQSSGNDIAAIAHGGTPVPAASSVNTWMALELATLVKESLDAGESTLRFMLGGNIDGFGSNNLQVVSVNSGTASQRPVLVVTYS